MATTTTPEAPSEVAPPHLGSRMSRAWPISYALAIVFTFVLYQWILPNSSQQVRDVFRAWMPLSAVNEAVIWAIFALGLNVVVGYAGLLDLGYVAFFAVGAHVAAHFGSAFWANAHFSLWVSNGDRNDWWVPDASRWTGNTPIGGAITPATETAEWNLWLQKLRGAGVSVGPTG